MTMVPGGTPPVLLVA